MEFDIENLEDVLVEAVNHARFADANIEEAKRLYDATAESIWIRLVEAVEADGKSDHEKEMAVLYMPRTIMHKSIERFYDIER